MHVNLATYSPSDFQSTGRSKNKKHRQAKKVQAAVDPRLKRFRMLDPDEFQEMLSSFNQQMPQEQAKVSNTMDSIGGMQLEST